MTILAKQAANANPEAQLFETPVDHFREVFGDKERSHGQVLVGWNPLRVPAWFKLNQEIARQELSRWTNRPDAFFTPNVFWGWRLTRLLSELCAFFVDFDFHHKRKVDFPREVANIMQKIWELHWPEPNFIVYTGRGFHLYWLLEPAPAKALPRWQAAQREIVKKLGGDRMVVDCTREMRIVGTYNTKAKIKVQGEWLHGKQFDFNWFCDEILPYTQAEIRDIRAARAKKGKDTKSQPKNVRGSIYQRWHIVYQDLNRILNYHWFGGVQEGYRDQMMFHLANSLSWFTVADALPDEICAIQRTWMPTLTKKEALSYCSSVVSRARATQNSGQESRYKYRRQTLWEQLEPLIPDDLLPNMRAIIPDDLAQQREAERQAERCRVSEGRYEKAQGKHDKGNGLRNRNKRIRRLASQGFSQQYIAGQVGISQQTVSNVLKTKR